MALDKAALAHNLCSVLQRIADVHASTTSAPNTAAHGGGAGDAPPLAAARQPPRLVAVSKTFGAECVAAAYASGQRHFGENYLHELQAKAPALAAECPDIRWHFIGRIQSNKIRKICETPGLWCVETLESEKHADILQRSCAELGIALLNVFIQVNTSREPNKGGVELEEVGDSTGEGRRGTETLQKLAKHIVENCPNLKLLGLMTIGSLAESRQSDDAQANSDFCALVAARAKVCDALKIADARQMELSMGMSGDFEAAIRHGATNVRVGSSIFGARNYGTKNR